MVRVNKKMDDTYQVNPDWEALAGRIVKPGQVVFVIGGTDAGKSTFCRFLADTAIHRGLRTAFVDTDIGQSRVGPPTTIGMKSLDGESPPVHLRGDADGMYFVGDVSPRGHFLEMLTGTRLMVESARETGADFVVVDTTGYVHDAPAVVLKQHKIELIRPDHVVCIGRSGELDQITAYYTRQDWIDVHYLLPHREVRPKRGQARSEYRNTQFDAYFGDPADPATAAETEVLCCSHEPMNRLQRLPFSQIRGGRTRFFVGRSANEKELENLSRLAETEVHYAEWGHRTLRLITAKLLPKGVTNHIRNYLSLERVTAEVHAYFERRLVGLVNAAGDTYAIAFIESVDFQDRTFSILSKPGTAAQARAIQFGSYQLSRHYVSRF